MEARYVIMCQSLDLSDGREWILEVLRDISVDEYSAIREAVRQVREFSRADLLPYVKFSLTSVLEAQSRLILELKGDVDTTDIESAQIELMWGIFTALSAIVLHQEQTKTKISRLHGKNSPQLRRANEIFSCAFDDDYSYRLCCKLRQYVVHRSMSSLALEMDRRYESGMGGEIEGSFDAYFDRDALLAERDVWKSLVRADIEAGPERVYPIPHLRRAVAVACEISARTRELIFPEVRKQIAVLGKVEQLFAGRVGLASVAELPKLIDLRKARHFNLPYYEIDFKLINEVKGALGAGLSSWKTEES